VLKESGSEVLFKAIEKVQTGEIWYDRSKMGGVFRDILQTANGRNVNPIVAKIETLTPREHEVIALVSRGLKNKDIGERLFISETTVRHHLTSVFEKLEVSNRLELIIFAFSQGLARLPSNVIYGIDEDGRAITNLLELPSM
jgi:two-component system, NarL family, nitrate/nitrite response regulator NarL